MNSAIERIKKQINDQQPQHKKKIDTDQDEDDAAKLMTEFCGHEWITTRAKSKYCRWDLEGKNTKGKTSRAEVKSRTYDSDKNGIPYETWIIDSYKIDKMLEKFPEDENYFINVFEGKFHVYCAKFVASCKKEVRKAWALPGAPLRTFYFIPRDQYITELSNEEAK